MPGLQLCPISKSRPGTFWQVFNKICRLGIGCLDLGRIRGSLRFYKSPSGMDYEIPLFVVFLQEDFMKIKFATLTMGLVALASAFLVACSKANNDTPPPVNVCSGLNCTPPPCVGSDCLSLGYGTRIGFYAQTPSYTYNNVQLPNESTYTLGSGLQTLLKKAMGVCDREHITGGLANCQSYRTGNAWHDLVFMMDGALSNEVRVIFRSSPNVNYVCNPYGGCAPNWYTYQLPSLKEFFGGLIGIPVGNMQGVFNPMVLRMTIHPVNDSKGFELRGYGPSGSAASNFLIQIIVRNGQVEDQTVNFEAYINSESIGSGTFVKCKTETCGLPFTGL